MEPGHHYDYVSMYPDQGGNEAEYEVVDQALAVAVSACQTNLTSYTSHLTSGSHPTPVPHLPLHPEPQVRGVGTGG